MWFRSCFGLALGHLSLGTLGIGSGKSFITVCPAQCSFSFSLVTSLKCLIICIAATMGIFVITELVRCRVPLSTYQLLGLPQQRPFLRFIGGGIGLERALPAI